MAECQLPKLNVAGSIPVTRSIFILALLLFSPALHGAQIDISDFWTMASGSGLDDASAFSFDQDALSIQLENGNRSALVPFVLLLVDQGRIEDAENWMEGRGYEIPVTRRDLAIALAWYGRFQLYDVLNPDLWIPPDLQDDDYASTIAAIIDLGWMNISADGRFHPEQPVGMFDLQLLSGSFFPSSFSWDRDWIGMSDLDSLFIAGIRESESR